MKTIYEINFRPNTVKKKKKIEGLNIYLKIIAQK